MRGPSCRGNAGDGPSKPATFDELSETPNLDHRDALRPLAKLRQAPAQQLAHGVLLKRMKMEAREFQALTHTLCQQGDIVAIEQPAEVRPSRAYRLVGGKNNG